ncbi:MAG: hypothetical protein HKP30_09010 [Myxococcales bacterium]|nr:hypothetical protein [Myxococcales bacterium]
MTKRNRKAWSIRPLGLVLTLIACGAFAGSATAAPIVTWDVANATGQDAAVLSTALNVSATSIDEVGVSEWTSTAQDGFVAASGWTADATGPDAGQYYEWSITADAGYGVTYDSFDVSLFRGIWGGGHGADLWELHASIDAFATFDLDLGTFDISASAADEQTTFLGHDISALGMRGGTVTFRLYGYNQTQAGDYAGLGNDDGAWLISGTGVNPVVHGTASVPEPRAALLAAMGSLGLLVGGRRR